MSRYLSIAIALLAPLAGCNKSKTASVSDPVKIEACSLITNKEVQAIQGSPVTEAKSSVSSDEKFRVSQCFYATQDPSQSVSLAVTQPAFESASAINPRDLWKQTFGRYTGESQDQEGDEKKKENLREVEEERGQLPPKKVSNIGDDAFWTANRAGGALYFLKDNILIRISVGGPESDESRMERSKALAAKALSRL